MLVAERRIGRYLLPDEVVHHLDEDRHNVAPENLCVMSRSLHMRIHRLLGQIGTELINAGYLSIVLHNIPDKKMREVVRRIYHDREPLMRS
jgi:hypothetical protein